MRSEAADVDVYLAEVPEERWAALVKLRALCVETLHGYRAGMDYGMPCYKAPGIAGKATCAQQVAFASQRGYISLYIREEWSSGIVQGSAAAWARAVPALQSPRR